METEAKRLMCWQEVLNSIQNDVSDELWNANRIIVSR